jgi:hypothetical protein
MQDPSWDFPGTLAEGLLYVFEQEAVQRELTSSDFLRKAVDFLTSNDKLNVAVILIQALVLACRELLRPLLTMARCIVCKYPTVGLELSLKEALDNFFVDMTAPGTGFEAAWVATTQMEERQMQMFLTCISAYAIARYNLSQHNASNALKELMFNKQGLDPVLLAVLGCFDRFPKADKITPSDLKNLSEDLSKLSQNVLGGTDDAYGHFNNPSSFVQEAIKAVNLFSKGCTYQSILSQIKGVPVEQKAFAGLLMGFCPGSSLNVNSQEEKHIILICTMMYDEVFMFN